MKKRRTIEKARTQPFVVETSRVQVIGWLILGSLGTIVCTSLLLANGHTTSTRAGCLALFVLIGILPLLVGLGNWPVGKTVIRMTESHLEVPEGNFSWDKIRWAELVNGYKGYYHSPTSIVLLLVYGSKHRVHDCLYTLPLSEVYWEIRKRIPNADAKFRRNERCPCGSRRKYKKCCGR